MMLGIPGLTPRGPLYPHAGTWLAGGYWDMDHGVISSGGVVSSVYSREGASLLAATGSPTAAMDARINRLCLVGAAGKYLTEIDATRWGSFGGIRKGIIAFAQFLTPAAGATNVTVCLSLINAANTDRALEGYLTNHTLTFFRVAGGTLYQTAALALADNTLCTVVFVQAGGLMYLITDAGTTPGAADAPGSISVDRFGVNNQAGALASNVSYRRWGVKLPATANPLTEAQDLYSQLVKIT